VAVAHTGAAPDVAGSIMQLGTAGDGGAAPEGVSSTGGLDGVAQQLMQAD